MEKLLNALRQDLPDIEFIEGRAFCWMPATRQIFYVVDTMSTAEWSLLHETAHAILEHSVYSSDTELLTMEVEAWDQAKALASNYGIVISNEHIENCLDSYRNWLHSRSICPTCENKSIQQTRNDTYRCFNCHTSWQVTPSRFCRPYRQPKEYKKSPVSFAATGDSLRQ